jgi:hypothetical protein
MSGNACSWIGFGPGGQLHGCHDSALRVHLVCDLGERGGLHGLDGLLGA